MKKVLSLVLALTMAACLAVPAFAVGSRNDGVTAPSGLTVGSTEVPAAAAAGIESNLTQTLQTAGVTVGSGETATAVYLEDLTGDPGTYTFTVDSAGPNDKLIVLHWNGSAWEKVGEGTGKTVTATFSSLSPVAIVLVKGKGPSTPTTPGTSGATTAPTSPQTGAPMAVPFTGIAVIALAGLVAVKARKKEM